MRPAQVQILQQLPSLPVCPVEEAEDRLDAASGAPSRYAQPVAVRIFQSALTPSKTLVVDGDAKLLRHRVDVVDVQVDKRVGTGIALVLGEVEPNVAARYGYKPREPWLKLVLPLLTEAEALVPPDSTAGILDIENRHDLLIHAGEPKRTLPSAEACSRPRRQRDICLSRSASRTPSPCCF